MNVSTFVYNESTKVTKRDESFEKEPSSIDTNISICDANDTTDPEAEPSLLLLSPSTLEYFDVDDDYVYVSDSDSEIVSVILSNHSSRTSESNYISDSESVLYNCKSFIPSKVRAFVQPQPVIMDKIHKQDTKGTYYTHIQLIQIYHNKVDMSTKHLINGYMSTLKMPINNSLINIIIAVYTFDTASYNIGFDVLTEHVFEHSNVPSKVSIVSSNGLKCGLYEWTVTVIKCDVHLMEIGVVENYKNTQNIHDGIRHCNDFGARAVYGNELFSNKHFYASLNDDNHIRCERAISVKIGWCSGDIIRVVMNLKKWNIEFWRNGKRVRSKMSLQKNKIYFPIILFSGNCLFETDDQMIGYL